MDRGAWQATIQGCKELDTTEQLTHTHTHACAHACTHTKKSRGFFHLVCGNPLPEIEVSGFQLSGDSVAVGNLINTAVCENQPQRFRFHSSVVGLGHLGFQK